MPIIEVDNVVKRYDGVAVVDGVSFTVDAGEIFAIVGPNGAGKTTTVESIIGLRQPDSGRITVLGLDSQRDGAALRQRVGAQLQESRLPDRIQVGEALDLYSSFYSDPAPWPDLMERLGLADKQRTRFTDLSGGQKQRLSVALALVGDPKIAVLDELTTGLDPQARRDTWDLIEEIRRDGVTIVLVTHFMEEAERLADRVAVIDHGRVVAIDTPAGLVAKVGAGQQIRFRPPLPFDEAMLAGLPEVTAVTWSGSQVMVTGTGNVLHAVTSVLARHHIVVHELRVDQANLDDAFVALTGRPFDEHPPSPEL